MSRDDLIRTEIAKLAAERRRLWSQDCPSRDVQIVALDAMMEALQWAITPRAAAPDYFTPFDQYKFQWQEPESVLVPVPDPSEYKGTPLEGQFPGQVIPVDKVG